MTDCSGKFYQQIPLGKAKDLTGQHFGKLVALFRVKIDKGSRKGAWLCQCECGNQKVVASLDLVSGNTQSCGCKKKETLQRSREDLTNQRFGRLVALRPTHLQGRTAWICQCDCGNTKVISADSLLHHNTRSCGCETGSIGENIIRELLLSYNYDFEEQVTFKDCLSPLGRPFRFDFGIYSNGELIRLIEYDGEFHYKTSNISSAENLQIRKNYDKIKTEYCLSHSIPLIRIPYWERNNVTLTTLLDETYLIK